MTKAKYPKYVKMSNSTCLRLTEADTYYRDAGAWEVGVETIEGKFYSVSSVKSVNGKLLTPCTAAEYRKDNAGYL